MQAKGVTVGSHLVARLVWVGVVLSGLLLLSLQPEPFAVSAASPPSPFGVAVLASGNPAYFAEAQAAGAKWVRLIVSWEQVEPLRTDPPTYDWTSTDLELANAANAGLTPSVVIMNNPQWAVQTLPLDPFAADPSAHIKGGPTDAAALPAFVQFVQAAANRYKAAPYNVHYWELYNEPDGTDAPPNASDTRGWYACWVGGCWGASAGKYQPRSPLSGAKLYAGMLKAVYPAIKAADPQAKIAFGALAFDQFQNNVPGCTSPYKDGGWYNYCFLDQVLKAGGGKYFDLLNFHYYVFMHDRWDKKGSGVIGKQKALQGILSKRNLAKPFICTEIGVQSSSVGEDGQARYAPQELVRVYAARLVAATWFTLDPNDSWELVHSDLSGKPAYKTYQVAAQQLGAFQYSGKLSPAVLGVEGYVFKNGTQKKWVLWVKWYPEGSPGVSGTRQVKLSANSLIVTDRFGSTTTVLGSNGKTALTVDQNPVYVVAGP